MRSRLRTPSGTFSEETKSNPFQAICQFYDKSVRTMVEHGVEVIDDMVELVVKIIGQAPHAAAIDLALQILTIHWQEKPVSFSRFLSVFIPNLGALLHLTEDRD